MTPSIKVIMLLVLYNFCMQYNFTSHMKKGWLTCFFFQYCFSSASVCHPYYLLPDCELPYLSKLHVAVMNCVIFKYLCILFYEGLMNSQTLWTLSCSKLVFTQHWCQIVLPVCRQHTSWYLHHQVLHNCWQKNAPSSHFS